ncbi:ABC transporter substrate-binding protein [Burkholderia multivorans]|uniref:ABC transporter substrate-binding protein n=1 Tax=Burkholderia multivorans TaxID=87883 RepID=A0AB37AQ03_9BURK|nr:ABC transporter substrate-binding protein [Burkholderia multivorans]PRE52217.1 ABC transporter substrate-binding protein [Burkholderia multivorans]
MKRAVCLIGSLCALTTAQLAEARDVVIAFEGSYTPWNMSKPDGTLDGFEPALAKVLCERAHLTCRQIAADWDSMIPALNTGKFDVIMDGMAITEARRQAIDFSIPYATVTSSFVTARGHAAAFGQPGGGTLTIDSQAAAKTALAPLRAALKGKVIGVQAATTYVPFVRTNFGDIAQIREYRSPKERDLDLVSGRIDASVENTVYLLNNAGSDLSLIGPVIGGKIWGEGVGMGLRKSDTALRDAFDKAIASVKADGTLSRLSLKYMKTDLTPR